MGLKVVALPCLTPQGRASRGAGGRCAKAHDVRSFHPGQVVAGSVAATLPGVLDSHLAVSFGYGLAMLWIGGLFLPACKGSPSALLALAYMAYGLKVRDRVG